MTVVLSKLPARADKGRPGWPIQLASELDNVETARLILSRPDRHTDDELRSACSYMFDHGDWMDFQLASLLQARLDEEAEEEATAAKTGPSLTIPLLFLGMVLSIGMVVSTHVARKALPQAGFDAVQFENPRAADIAK